MKMFAASALSAGLVLPSVLFAQGGPPPNAAWALGLLCVAVPFAILIVRSVGAAILRTACSVCGVEPPSFFSAMGVFFATRLAVGAAESAIGFGMPFLGPAAGVNDPVTLQVAGLLI